MMEGLKPCPFCGGEAKVMDMGFPHWVYCTKCGAKAHGRTHDEKDSIKAWNRRVLKKQNVPDTNVGDLISRQAAIDCFWTKERYFRDALDVIKDIRQLPSEQSEQRWIPCSEKLPKEKDAGILKKLGIEKRSEYVLATVEVKGERITAIVCTLDGKWHWKMKHAFPDFKVIAWMSLPAPFELQESEDKNEI